MSVHVAGRSRTLRHWQVRGAVSTIAVAPELQAISTRLDFPCVLPRQDHSQGPTKRP
jgi:hypothetical protein